GAATHLGVASCAGSTCHGATVRSPHSSVQQNEYLIWSQETDPARIDKHHIAYRVLLGDRARRIARNLGIANAATAPLCLNCHADNVPPAQRGPQFNIADGVGCEACHGGASKWLGVHLSGQGHQANLAAGLYPTKNPAMRAKKCLSCHFGDPSDAARFVTHKIMGAGHPRMPFELDTFTWAEPAHFVVNKTYIQRKGPVSDARVWAVGQAATLGLRLATLTDPQHAPKGVNAEFVLFDCASCHHGIAQPHWRPRPATGLPPGALELDDSNAVMLRVIADRAEPPAGKQLGSAIPALQQATLAGWPQVVHDSGAMRQMAASLEAALGRRNFTPDDLKALAAGVMAVGLNGEDTEFAAAEQAAMALGAIAGNMRMAGMIDQAHLPAINAALDDLGKSVADEAAYRPEAFVAALKTFQKALPR
ncbi:MAG TPA: multiheme c-type cytochrome, partial [Stellaceae bacterium]|nr:multiheme c-type cytochrome [Stellaceae bacterium]